MPRTARYFMLAILLLAFQYASAQDSVEAGRRIYEDGVLPDGSLLVATRPEGLYLEGKYAACVTCHRRSGMGSIEGVVDAAILVPPLAGPLLFSPARFTNSFLDTTHHYVPHITWRRALTRPAYADDMFAAAMRDGVNSAGQAMEAPMPLYDLDSRAAASLLAYLRQLTSQPAPGVEDDQVHIATIVTPDAHPDDVASVLSVIRTWTNAPSALGKRWTLHEWYLQGPDNTWQAQLDTLYEKQPVFAVLSGSGGAEWQPVHDYCEQRALPCILPSVYAAPIDRDSWYSLYFSAGTGLEARILARHIDQQSRPGRIVQIVGDAAGRHAAGVFAERSAAAAVDIRTWHATAPAGVLDDLRPDDTVILWLRADDVTALTGLVPDGLPVHEVFLSALLATPEDAALPTAWRKHARFVTLFDDLSLQADIARLRFARWLRQKGLDTSLNRRVQADAYAAGYLLNEALAETRQQEERRPAVPLSREHVIEILEDLISKYADGTAFIDTESHVAWYGRMSLGPGQRIAARGGTIVRYADNETLRVTAVSERIVPR